MVEGGMKLVKVVLFIFNLIFFLAGLGLIICGALVKTELQPYFDFYAGSVTGLAVLLIVVGCIIFIIGFFGCCGAYKENYCMTMTFAVLLAIVFLLEIAGGISAYILRDQVGNEIENKMLQTMNSYPSTTDQSAADLWDKVQMEFNCCGTNNYTDWSDIGNFGQDAGGKWNLPDSCCMRVTDNCGASALPSSLNTIGCSDSFVEVVKNKIWIIGGVGIGLAFVQIIGIMLSCCLARAIKKDYAVV